MDKQVLMSLKINGDVIQKTEACLNNTCSDNELALVKRIVLLTTENLKFSLLSIVFSLNSCKENISLYLQKATFLLPRDFLDKNVCSC